MADTPEKQERYLKTIYNKANEMNTLINELTLYSNIDTNKIPYNFHKLNVKDYFTDCMEELEMDLENQHMQLTFFNYVDEDTLMIADPEQAWQGHPQYHRQCHQVYAGRGAVLYQYADQGCGRLYPGRDRGQRRGYFQQRPARYF